MKKYNLILVLMLIAGMFLFGCNESTTESRGTTSYNLLDKANTEIPFECRPPISTLENKMAFVRFRGRANRCYDLMVANPELLKFDIVRNCLRDVGESFRLVPDTSCKETVLDHRAPGSAPLIMREMVRFYYEANITVADNKSEFKWDEVDEYFSILGVWFDQTRDNMYPRYEKEIMSDLHASEFEDVFLTFWSDIQSYDPEWKDTFGMFHDGTVGDEQAKLFDVFNTMLTANQKVLDKAFESNLVKLETTWNNGDSQMFPSPILAAIIGDSLNPVMQRIKIVAKIFDISCKLSDSCRHESYEKSRLYRTLKFFKTIGSGDDYSIIDMPEDQLTRPLDKLLKFLDKKSEVFKSINNAIVDSFQVDSISTAVAGYDYPFFIKSYKRIFEEGFDMILNYQNTSTSFEDGEMKAGFFTTNAISEVNIGFSENNMQKHISKVKNANSELKILTARYEEKKKELLQNVLIINDAGIKLDELEDRINIELTRLMNMKNQMDSIRHYIHEEHGSFYSKVLSIVGENEQNPSGYYVPTPENYFNVGAPTTSEEQITQINSSGELANIKKGDILRINITGEWTPTCAVSLAYGDGIKSARTGPRGYTLIETDGKSKVKSTNTYRTRASYSDSSLSVTACAGIKGGPEPFVASINVCASHTMGERREHGVTHSEVNSTSRRTDASFDMGIILPNTPYSNMPAGSLLLVEKSPDGTLLNASVLNTQNTIVVENDNSKFYLVSNDCLSASDQGYALAVQVSGLRAEGTLATEYAFKIDDIMGEISERVRGLVESGQLTYKILESIKLELLGEQGTEINQFSPTMRNLLQALVESEISVLDYKSRLSNMERDFEIEKQKINDLLHQFKSGTEQKKLRIATRNWMLSNIDLDFVNTGNSNRNLYTLNRILEILENNLVSYIDFKYRNEEKDYILGNLDLLKGLDFSDSFEIIAERVSIYVDELLDAMIDDIENKPYLPKTTVGIRIPNPYYVPTFENPLPENSLHPIMNTSRSVAIWETLKNWNEKKKGNESELFFNIYIDDIYQTQGLGCFVESPVIESMGLFFIPENEGYITDFNNNYRYKNAKLYLDGLSVIPFEYGPKTYNFVNLDWRYMDAANRMAKNANDAMRLLTTEFPPELDKETGLGTGRPLFGKFKIGFLRPYNVVDDVVYIGDTPLTEIKELFIGYVLSAANGNFDVNLGWINYCAK